MIFYICSHTGILYDCTANRQCLLQGHVSREVEGEVWGGGGGGGLNNPANVEIPIAQVK